MRTALTWLASLLAGAAISGVLLLAATAWGWPLAALVVFWAVVFVLSVVYEAVMWRTDAQEAQR